MSIPETNRNEVIGIRMTKQFIDSFDVLCGRLGFRRSTVARYALRRFINEHTNNLENLERAKVEIV